MIFRNAHRKIPAALAILAVLVVGILLPGHARAQVVGGTLSGTVTDPSGAAIPGTRISIKNVATGVTTNVTTDSAGFYSSPNLLPGTYEVTA